MRVELRPDFLGNRDRTLALARLDLGHGGFVRDHNHVASIPFSRFSSVLGSGQREFSHRRSDDRPHSKRKIR